MVRLDRCFEFRRDSFDERQVRVAPRRADPPRVFLGQPLALRAKDKDDGAQGSVEVGSLLVEAIAPAGEGATVEELSYARVAYLHAAHRSISMRDILPVPGTFVPASLFPPRIDASFHVGRVLEHGQGHAAENAEVGLGVLGSAAGMDKDVMKSLFLAAGLPIVKHVTILRSQWGAEPKKVQKLVESRLKYPVFVKPANLGSSVGISKARDRKELGPAIGEAAKFDRKIVIEEGVGGKKLKAREIECSVLGNDKPEASVPGEIVPGKEFYDYTAKYLDEGSELIIPAKLTKAETRKIQQLAISAFKAVDCSGLARVDFLMDPENREIYLNEINTMPGFTSISMYPKLWAASGLEYSALIERLIQLGQERHAEKKRNQYSR